MAEAMLGIIMGMKKGLTRVGPFVQQDLDLLEEGVEAAHARADERADRVGVFGDGVAGVLQRHGGRGRAVLGVAVHALGHLLVDEVARRRSPVTSAAIFTGYSVVSKRWITRDARAAGQQALQERLLADADGRDHPDAGDHHPLVFDGPRHARSCAPLTSSRA